MKSFHIHLDIQIEDDLENLYKSHSKEIELHLKQKVNYWIKENLETRLKKEIDQDWINFLKNIDDYAVDTGIEDLSINHEFYANHGVRRK